MRDIDERELAAHFDEFMVEVENGEMFTITRDGRPVAILAPAAYEASMKVDSELTVEEAIQATLEFGERHTGGKPSVRELIEEGRKY